MTKWKTGMKQKMTRLIFERKMFIDESMDNSANELYLNHVRDLSEAWAKDGTLEGAERKLAVKTLWRAGGRGGEAACIALTGIKWNHLHSTPCLECPQPKTSKLKLIPYVAGIDRHSDWLIDFGDVLTLRRGSMVWREAEEGGKKMFLLPDLIAEKDGKQTFAGASTKIGNYLKAMQPKDRGGQASWAHVAIETLPPQPTAAGFRPGAADTLCISVPVEMAIHNTGHDMTKINTIWNYLDTRVALCIPGAIVLAGHDPLPYGQIGKGPAHPLLKPIIDMGPSLERLDMMINLLFSLYDDAPPMFHIGCPLRPMIHATFATLVMYYEERFKAGEMETVLRQMRDSYNAMAAPTDDVHAVLIEWGKAVKAQFDVDNLHLTGRLDHGGSEQVVTSVKQLAATINRQHAQVAHLSETTFTLRRQVQQQNETMAEMARHMNQQNHTLAQISQLLSNIQLTNHQHPTSPPPAVAASPIALDTTMPPAGNVPPAGNASLVPPTDSASPIVVPPIVSQPAPSKFQKHDAGGSGSNLFTLVGKTAPRLYMDCMVIGGVVPFIDGDQDGKRKSEANYVFELFNAMATPTERSVLMIPYDSPARDEGQANRIAQDLNRFVTKRILESLAKSDVGRFTVTTNTINAIVSKGKTSGIKIDSTMFAQWRNPASVSSSQPLLPSTLGKRPQAEMTAAVAAELHAGSPSRAFRPNRSQPTPDSDLSGEEDSADGNSNGASPDKPMKVGLGSDSDSG